MLQPWQPLAVRRQAIADARETGFVPAEFQARLTLAETEIRSGENALARAELQALEKHVAGS